MFLFSKKTMTSCGEFLSATLGDEKLEKFQDVFLLLVSRLAGAQHVEVHARANWGLTPYATDKCRRKGPVILS